jgi:hypothetical protein
MYESELEEFLCNCDGSKIFEIRQPDWIPPEPYKTYVEQGFIEVISPGKFYVTAKGREAGAKAHEIMRRRNGWL